MRLSTTRPVLPKSVLGVFGALGSRIPCWRAQISTRRFRLPVIFGMSLGGCSCRIGSSGIPQWCHGKWLTVGDLIRTFIHEVGLVKTGVGGQWIFLCWGLLQDRISTLFFRINHLLTSSFFFSKFYCFSPFLPFPHHLPHHHPPTPPHFTASQSHSSTPTSSTLKTRSTH